MTAIVLQPHGSTQSVLFLVRFPCFVQNRGVTYKSEVSVQLNVKCWTEAASQLLKGRWIICNYFYFCHFLVLDLFFFVWFVFPSFFSFFWNGSPPSPPSRSGCHKRWQASLPVAQPSRRLSTFFFLRYQPIYVLHMYIPHRGKKAKGVSPPPLLPSFPDYLGYKFFECPSFSFRMISNVNCLPIVVNLVALFF